MRILFLLDGSGSMLAEWKGERRIDVAKRILSGLIDSLKSNKNIELALRVYGHLYSRDKNNCQDTRLEVPFGSSTHERIKQALQLIDPKGTTPIAYSLQKAATDFPESEGYRNIIIIITDGLESCDGDPCAISLSLQQKEIFLKPFIVGIGNENDSFQKQFNCVGKYYDAIDEIALQKSLAQAISTSMAKTTATVALYGNTKNINYSNVNVTFINDFTGTAAFDFIHYLDKHNKPDTVQVDPVLSYQIVVNTLPPVYLRQVEIIPGRHNNIVVQTPQGNLQVNQRNSKTYKNPVQVLLKKTNGEIFHIQNINTTEKYIEGKYQIEITTLPRLKYNIEIKEGKSHNISIPDPGILNFSGKNGFGSIYKMDRDNTQEWVQAISPDMHSTAVALQPGKYKVVFRSKNALGSKYTTIRHFTINSGESLMLRLL